MAKEPDNTDTLDTFGAFLCEYDDEDRGRELLHRSIGLRPERGHEKFLYLAQMESGEEALNQYQRGIEALRNGLGDLQSQPEGAQADAGKATAETLRRELASTLAAVAELYMTDLCDLDDAEERCERALQDGLDADPKCLEVLSTKATLRRVQGKLDESLELAKACAASVKAAHGRSLLEEEAAPDAPSLNDEALTALCRTLIDLGEIDEAREILEGMLEKNQEDVAVWHLLGACHLMEGDAGGVQECVENGLKSAKKQGKEALKVWAPNLRDLMKQLKKGRGGTVQGGSSGSGGS